MLNRSDFLELPPEWLRTLQIIHIAMALGVCLFAGVVALLLSQPHHGHPSAAELEQATVLSGVNGLLLLSCLGAALFVPGQIIKSASRESLEAFWPGLQAAYIVRLALLEGSALLGLVVCLLCVTNGVLQASPIFALNAGSAVIFLLAVWMVFPDRDRLSAQV